MVVQVVLDSLSRCFGAPGQTASNRAPTGEVNGQIAQNHGGTGPTSSSKSNSRYAEEGETSRRQGRALGIELHDQEWDALFADGSNVDRKGKRGDNGNNNNMSRNSKTGKRAPDMEVGYADVLQKTKEAAKPSRHVSPRKIDRKMDIFRTKTTPNPSFASRILGHDRFARALCFATPVYDCGQEVTKADTYGANTVNTAEDTLTSTVCFEAKHSHLVETRPPMPLFHRYKVDCNDYQENALIGIVNSGSHQSVHMIRAFQEHAEQNSISNNNIKVGSRYSELEMETNHETTNKLSKAKDHKKSAHDHPPEMQTLSDNSMSTDPSSRSISSGNYNSPQAYSV